MPVASHCADYLRKREADERALAEQSTDPDAKAIYLRLAQWYRTLAENADMPRQPATNSTAPTRIDRAQSNSVCTIMGIGLDAACPSQDGPVGVESGVSGSLAGGLGRNVMCLKRL